MPRTTLIVAVSLLDAAILLYLAGSVTALAMFVAFVAFLVIPAVLLARRIAPMPVAGVMVVAVLVPWYFLRKASGMPLVTDLVTAALLTLLAARTLKRQGRSGEPDLTESMPTGTFVMCFLVVPLLFALVWLGWNAVIGNEVHEFGLFAVDFGNLVSVVSTLRASSLLPMSYVVGGGALSYHWLYYTIPAALADFAGGSMPNANALVLANLLMAILLIHAVSTISGSRRAAAIALFAPFTTYYYFALAARVPLGPLGVPFRNNLLLSPLNSMVTFGNNTVALVLAIVTLVELERWNRDGRWRDALIGVAAVALIPGFSITLAFPLSLTLSIWTVLGRVRRPLTTLAVAASGAGCSAILFRALHVIGVESSRHLAVGFDQGQFLRMVAFGLLPLWGIALLSARRGLTIFHVMIASCVVLPSFLYVDGPGGNTDFSMKTASLLAVSFAPLLNLERLAGKRALAAAILVALGLGQSAAYVLQFPWYRLTRGAHPGTTLSRDYFDTLAWVRNHTPTSAIVIDPHELTNEDEILTVALAERRIWLPTAYVLRVMVNSEVFNVAGRAATWRAFAEQRDQAAGLSIAREADILIAAFPVASRGWRAVHREGRWTVYQSTLHASQ